MTFVVFNVTNIAYVIWASGEVQPWNTPHLMNKSVENAYDSDDDIKKPKAIEDKKKSDD